MFIFFFSSRRRHTRCSRDWSSDVCSSDLVPPDSAIAQCPRVARTRAIVSASHWAARRGNDSISSTTTLGEVTRSEEHTSELQSRLHLVCRLLLEKKKKNTINKKRAAPIRA